MNIQLAIVIVVCAVIVYLILKYKLSWMQFHFSVASKALEDKAIELADFSNKLNDYAKQLEDKLSSLEKKSQELEDREFGVAMRNSEIEERTTNLQKLIDHNQNILNLNNKTLKANSTQLFHIQQASSDLYEHYITLCDLIDGLRKGQGIDPQQLDQFYDMSQQCAQLIDSNFTNLFKMTCDQYKRKKIYILGERRDPDLPGLMTQNSLN